MGSAIANAMRPVAVTNTIASISNISTPVDKCIDALYAPINMTFEYDDTLLNTARHTVS
jgi:hypothetical protein